MKEEQFSQELSDLANILQAKGSVEELSVVVGFDGFVDEIIEVVDKRESFDTYKRMETITQLGTRIQKAAGFSTNIELVPKTVKLGGNGPIMANALVSVGTNVNYIGALGKENIHPVFSELTERCTKVVSLAEPGHTDALEFHDGKVMLGKIESLNDVNWANLKDTMGERQISALFSSVDLIATVNWTMMPYMNEIWEGLLHVLPIAEGNKKPILFVDLADPEKRSNKDIVAAMRLIERFEPYYRVVLGLNRKEASEIAEVLNVDLSDAPQNVTLEEVTRKIAQALKVWCVMVHPTHEAAAFLDGEYAHSSGPYTSSPKLTTGAGDNFNSGFCLGLLLGLPLQKALMLGTATSGYYVRNMHSPSFGELVDFLRLWAAKVGQEF